MRCIPAEATQDVDAYGVCRRITNTRSLAMMVPLGSAVEWTTAYSNASALATVAPCYAYAWTGWSGWSGCSASCGGGSQSQTRTCLRTETGVAGGVGVDPAYCGGGPSSQSQSCNTQSCCTPLARVDGYGGCSAGCGGGSQDVYWSDGCGGTWTTSQSCNTHSCCVGNAGQSCDLYWCVPAGPAGSCDQWYNGPTTCERPYGGRITSCTDGGDICCAAPYNHIQCDGSCR